MQVAVSAINIAIYINPTLAFLTKLALISATIGEDGTQTGNCMRYSYFIIRDLIIILMVKSRMQKLPTLAFDINRI